VSERAEKMVVSEQAAFSSREAITKTEYMLLEERLSQRHAPVLAASTAAGAVAGALAGALGGPVGAAIGGLVGAAIGAAAGEALEESTEAHDVRDAELDAIIGVEGGDIGARRRQAP
jgi:phage tail tape-measure protein